MDRSGASRRSQPKHDEIVLTPQEAVAGILLVTVTGHGEVSAQEEEAFIATSNRMELLRHQTATEFKAMLHKIANILSRMGPDALLASSSAALPRDLRETAFAVAVDLVADRPARPDERKTLKLLQKRLGVANDLAERIVEVLAIKNRG
jgi:hypothetical protein